MNRSESAENFPALKADNHRIALQEGDTTWRYSDVDQRIDQFASGLLGDNVDLDEERIAFLMPASLDYVTVLLGV